MTRRRTYQLGHAVLAAVVGATLLVTAGCGSAAQAAELTPSQLPLSVGVSLPTYHYSTSAVTDWQSATGRRPDVVQSFLAWEYAGQPGLNRFPVSRANDIAKLGSTLEITWGPNEPNSGVQQPRYSLANIAVGHHDAYIRQFAQDVKRFDSPIRIRLMHEMNGSWMPWSEANSGNSAGDFVRAWRHIHNIFGDVGATNVTWVWSPNIIGANQTPLPGLYPGDAYVDLVGVDGYSYPVSDCPRPAELFQPTLEALHSLSRRPIVLAEVGVSVACPGREQWIQDFFDFLALRPDVTGFTWWERTGGGDSRTVNGTDFRLALYPSDLAVFRAGLAKRKAPVSGRFDRVAGVDRIATAVAVSKDRFPHQARGAVLASANDFADALAGAALADYIDGPLLLTAPEQLDARVAADLVERARGRGVIYLLGGPVALSPAVEASVRSLGFTTMRLQGADRYETAAAVAREISPDLAGQCDYLLATGVSFADGAAASGAASEHRPILFTVGDALPSATVKELVRCAETAGGVVTAVGGPAAAASRSSIVPEQLRRRAVVGADRYQTSALLLEAMDSDARASTVVLASGLDYADALVGGTYRGPVVLTHPARLPSSVASSLAARGQAIERLVVIGGRTAIAETTAQAASAAMAE